MTQHTDEPPSNEPSPPWQQHRDRWDMFWLDGKIPEQWIRFQEFGVSRELFVEWIKTMRRPIREWQEISWYPTTEENARELGLDERRELARENALKTFREFLQKHPELPTAAIRPLLHATVSDYHERYGMANPGGRAEVIQREENLFLDQALHFYRDGELPPTTTQIAQQQTEIHTAVAEKTESG